jgi:hypothetical protein
MRISTQLSLQGTGTTTRVGTVAILKRKMYQKISKESAWGGCDFDCDFPKPIEVTLDDKALYLTIVILVGGSMIPSSDTI